ncbi:unnamed protein product [Phyllotreta striolata]|uniref:Tyrosine-protein phosphatase non-receptor type 23 n=1 Tax=Phyllotreta striolata TaxID=444603 RepID=A0A9N9TE20_PHYSR|nr:unnamed protein product [Phyllotreta striolata]
MEAAPKLPMISFDLKTCMDNVHFGPQLKKYIAAFYGEDPDSYITEINNLESLRAAAVRPTSDFNGVQLLKKYYCQLHFLKSRFPMEENQDASVQFSWRNNQLDLNYACTDIRYELMVIMYNIGALHSYLGASDSRSNPDGMKMSCTHFQCAAWAFQTVKEKYHQFIMFVSLVELVHFFQQVSLAQAQECILEKSMFDNRKPTIIAKVAVQVYSYYRQSLSILESVNEDYFRDKIYKEWIKFLQFKIAYYKCISLLFHGQQAEEQQKMGERVAYYQAACEQLEEAKKCASNLKNQHQQQEVNEALAFTTDVVEGKRKAAKNENEFIYHESVPDKDQLVEVKGASLVKGIPFSINDAEVSGTDIFSRLVPMEAHEAASLYSEKKAQILRQIGELIDSKDQSLAEFMSSMQLDLLTKMHQATGIPQDLIDRAAALAAKPNAVQDLINSMGKLSNIYQDVEASLNEIDELLKGEEAAEASYQEKIGKRPPSILATDLTREAAKYREAHTKANDSNQTLHRAMTAHVANLKVLQRPLKELQHNLPFVELPNPNIDEKSLKDLESLVAKVEEMRNQRAMLWAQLREAVHNDDITSSLVTKQPNQSLEQLFQQELQKHQQLITLIEQNTAAQENIKKALVDSYAQAVNSRRYIQDILQRRSTTISSLLASSDSYDDLLSKANKGIEFYTKLETNVTKLLQRIKSTCKVQQEERDQVLGTSEVPKVEDTSTTAATAAAAAAAASATAAAAPKLKDYLESRKRNPAVNNYPDPNIHYPQVAGNYGVNVEYPPGVRPTPVGSDYTDLPKNISKDPQNYVPYNYNYSQVGNTATQYSDEDIVKKMNSLLTDQKNVQPQNYLQYSYNNYVPQNYSTIYQSTQNFNSSNQADMNSSKAYTTTTNSYESSQTSVTAGYVQYPDSHVQNPAALGVPANYQYQSIPPQSNTSTAEHHNVNVYYPQGYAPNQSASNSASDHYVDGQVKYHSVEYSSSVQPNISNYKSNNFYSSPIPNMASTNSMDSNGKMENANNYTYPSTSVNSNSISSLPDNSYLYNQVNSVSSTLNFYPANSYSNISQVYPSSSDTQQYLQASQFSATLQSNTNATYTSSTSLHANQGQASMYSSNHSNYDAMGQPVSPYYPSTSVVGQPTSSYMSSQSYNQMYTGVNANLPTQTQQGNMTVQGEYSANYGYQNYYPTGTYNAPASTTATVQNTQTQPAKSSNVDLLSGLDFNIAHAPLVPQQNVVPQTKESEAQPSKQESAQTKPPEAANPAPEQKVQVKRTSFNLLPSKSLNNKDVKNLFNQEWDKYEKFVETLSIKTLSGPTNLDIKWKEIQDQQDCDSQRKIISVARCYPMKNRFPDILPYDHTRVELCDSKDDYINASFIKDISPYAPPFIVTQIPLASTIGDFWTMIREQQVELILCLQNDAEIGSEIYWPKEKGQSLNILNMVITLQSIITKTHWIERLISVNLPEKRESRVVLHLQFTSWPGSLFPTTSDPFVSYILEAISMYQQQKSNTHPVVVHCSSGIGRSGLICILTAAIFDVTNNANSMPDLTALAIKVSNYRKNVLRDREHLKFAYECFLAYIRQVLSEDKMRKKLNEFEPKEEVQPISIIPEANIDPLSTLDPFWASKK